MFRCMTIAVKLHVCVIASIDFFFGIFVIEISNRFIGCSFFLVLFVNVSFFSTSKIKNLSLVCLIAH